MADAAAANIAGSVVVSIGGDTGPLAAALARAEQMAMASNSRLAAALSNSGAGAALAKVAAPAAVVALQIDKVGSSAASAAVGLSSGAVSASAMAKALEMTGGNLAKVTPEMLGLAAANDAGAASTIALADATTVATAKTVAMSVAQTDATHLSAGVTREFSVLGAEVLRGNFSRIPGSLLVMNERLVSSGTGVLTLKNSMAALGGLGEVIFNPFILGFLGITIGLEAVTHLFGAIIGGSGDVEEALKRHKDLITQIAAAYPVAADAAKRYEDQAALISPNAALSQSKDDLADQAASLNKLTAGLHGVVELQRSLLDTSSGVSFLPHQADIERIMDDFQRLGGSAKDVSDKLYQIRMSPDLPGRVRDEIDAFNELLAKIVSTQGAVDGLSESIKLLNIVNNSFASINTDPHNGTHPETDFGVAQLAKQGQSAAAFQAQMGVINAVTPDQKRSAAERQKAVELDGQTMSTALRLQEVAQAGQIAYAQALKSSATASAGAFQTTTNSILKQTAALQTEALSYGKSTAEIEAAKIQTQLLTAAQQDHLVLSKSMIVQINAQAQAYGRAAQAAKLASVNDNAMFERSQLGRSDGEQSIAATLRNAVGGDYINQMNGPTASILRMNAALQESKELATDFASTFASDLEQGKTVTDALSDSFGNLGQQLIQIALNQAISSLFSNLMGTMGGGDNKGWGSIPGNNSGASGGLGGILSSIGHIFGFAGGTLSAPGGLAMVGERGPELVQLPRGARVNTASQTAGLLNTVANNNAANSNMPAINISVDARGAQAGVGAEIAAALSNFSRHELPVRFAEINANPSRRG